MQAKGATYHIENMVNLLNHNIMLLDSLKLIYFV